MKQLLVGNHKSAITMLWFLGWLGVLLCIGVHFGPWYIIGEVKGNGLNTDLGYITLFLVLVYAVLLAFRSVYSMLIVVLLFACVLEVIVGLHLLRYMPFDSTKLTAVLYVGLPCSLFLMFLGACGTIADKFIVKQTK